MIRALLDMAFGALRIRRRASVGSTMVPADPRARREWIKYQLGLKGLTFRRLALRAGLDASAVRQALYKPYPRQERLIAAELGLVPELLWPERYDGNGKPNRRRGRPITAMRDKDGAQR